ncbi:hypothetical protein H7X68_01480 [Candidatus Saccharibacteria bacterium]|nr:hypothetical protein [Candidatus Saccharibacteria bacterium]
MIWVNFFPIISGITALFLAGLVLLAGARMAQRLSFALFAGSMGVWSICIGLFLLVTDTSTATALAVIYYIAAILLIYGLSLFSYVFVRGDMLSMKKFIILGAVFFCPIAAMIVTILIPGLFIVDVYLDPVRFVMLGEVPYAAYSLLFAVYGSVAIGVLARYKMSHETPREKRQQIIIAWLIGLCLPTAAIFNLVLPLIGNYSLIAIGPILTLLAVAGFFYTIMKHSLFDIHLAIVRTVAYILSLATMTATYFLLAYVISDFLLGQSTTTAQSITSLTLALILAFAFQPIKRFFDQLTSTVFYKNNYNNDDFLARLSKALTSTTDLRGLLERSANEIARTLKSEQAFFFINTKDGHYISAGTLRHKQLPKNDTIQLSDAQNTNQGMIVASLLENDDPIRRLMLSHRIELILPLVQAGSVIGYLCLGEHLTSGYTIRDLKVLGTFSDEMAISIRNALSIQEVKDLNETLQQRVNEATKELRASNSQLQRLDKAKDEFVGMASHQLRTPLTSVKGYLSMVIEGDAGKITESQKQLLEEAFTSSERMVHLINDFLNVSRLQTGKFLIDKRPINLAKVVEQELDSLVTTAASRNLTFSYKAPKDFPMLDLDEGKMRQVIMNFADNALYYSAEHTNIFARLAIEGEDVVFAVKDSGIGVPQAEQSQLFSKFYRASNARKQRPDGTGVGLFLAKKVIDAHGGKVIFESVEGQGSTFGFRLPLDKLRSVDDANQLVN